MNIKDLVSEIKRNGLLSSMPKLEELYRLSIENEEKIAALEARYAALAAENAGLKGFGDKLYSMYKGLETSGGGFHDEQSIPYQQAALDAAISAFEEIKTPGTDASMAEVRASGVEMFAESQKEYIRKNRSELDSMTRAAYCGSAVDAERFAAQLRKGGEHDERQSFLSDEDRHAFVKAFTKGADQ